MEEIIQNLIDRVKSEGQLTRNSGTHSIKSVKQVLLSIEKQLTIQTSFLESILLNSTNAIQVQKAKQTEEIEDQARNSAFQMKDRTEEIESVQKVEKAKEIKEDINLLDLLGLGLVAKGIVVGIGAITGAITGQLIVLKNIIGGTISAFKGFTDVFTPKFISDSLSKFKLSLTPILTSMSDTFLKMRLSFIDMSVTLSNIFKSITNSKPVMFLGKTMDLFLDGVKAASVVLKTIVMGPLNFITKNFSFVFDLLSKMGSSLSSVAKLAGKIFIPLSLVIAGFEAIKNSFNLFLNGKPFEGIKVATTAFVNSLVFAPLDLIKDVTAWIVRKMGFENAADSLKSFSFVSIFSSLTDGIFNTSKNIVSYIKDFMSFDSEKLSNLLSSIPSPIDLILSPYNAAINWIGKKFKWIEPETEFNIQDELKNWVSNLSTWFSDFIPNIDDISKKIKEMTFNLIPKRLRGLFFTDEEIASLDVEEASKKRRELIEEMEKQKEKISRYDSMNEKQRQRQTDPREKVKDIQKEIDALNQNSFSVNQKMDYEIIPTSKIDNSDIIIKTGKVTNSKLVSERNEDFKILDEFIKENREKSKPIMPINSNSGNTTDSRSFDQRSTTIINNTSPHKVLDPALP